MSCRAINDALDMSDLPRCQLPSYDEILATVFSGTLVMQFDFKSFFFQFDVPLEVRHFFGFRACQRHRRMTRLPMGYAPAPQAAQAVTNLLVQESCANVEAQGLAWIDNAIFSGDSSALFQVHETFTTLCRRYQVVIGEYESPAAYTTLLGIEVNLRLRQWRMDPAWVAKTLPAARALLALGRAPLRLWWRISGAFLWRFLALRLPLHGALKILTWMSTTSQLRLPWDNLYTLSDEVSRALHQQTESLAQNPWQSWSRRELPTVQVVCDASLSGWAVVLDDLQAHHGKFWGDLRGETIYMKELFAAYKAVKLVCSRHRWENHRIILFGDNQAVIGAIRKGVSHVVGAQHWLDGICQLAEAHGCRVDPEYVKSSDNIADQYTRL